MKFLPLFALATVASASYLDNNFIPNYRRAAHGPDDDGHGAPTPSKPSTLAARDPQGLGGAGSLPKLPKGSGSLTLPKPTGAAGGMSGMAGMAGMSHGSRKRAPQGLGGAAGGLPKLPKGTGSLSLPKPTGAAGSMAGMSHGHGSRKRAPQGGAAGGLPKLPKGTGSLSLPKPTGAAGGMAGMAGMAGMSGGAKGSAGGHSHGGKFRRQVPKGVPKASTSASLPKASGAAKGMGAGAAGGHSHGS